jgi:hypothetical protein
MHVNEYATFTGALVSVIRREDKIARPVRTDCIWLKRGEIIELNNEREAKWLFLESGKIAIMSDKGEELIIDACSGDEKRVCVINFFPEENFKINILSSSRAVWVKEA